MLLSKEHARKYGLLANKMREKAAASLNIEGFKGETVLIKPDSDAYPLYSHYMRCNALAVGLSNLALEDNFTRKARMRKIIEDIADSVRESSSALNLVDETRSNFGGVVYEDL